MGVDRKDLCRVRFRPLFFHLIDKTRIGRIETFPIYQIDRTIVTGGSRVYLI